MTSVGADVRVICVVQDGVGWSPVIGQARLVADLLGASLELVPEWRGGVPGRNRAYSLLPRRRGGQHCIVIAARPGHLYAASSLASVLHRHGTVVGWIADSIWFEEIPRIASGGRWFDHLLVTNPEDVEPWHAATGVATSWMPLGADVLDRGSNAIDRPVDVQRYGREPTSWNDDDLSRARCERAGLRFAGRPPYHADDRRNLEETARWLARSKFVLGFGQAENRAPNLHPTRQYLTHRFAEILASGAVIAGSAPRCDAADRLLWPGAVLDLPADPDAAMPVLVDAVTSWSPELARRTHHLALERFDWRWRIAELATMLDIASPRLDAEMARLAAAIAEGSGDR